MTVKVVIVSGFPVSQNPRVVKEADALAKLGYDVHVLSAIYNKKQIQHTESILQGRLWNIHYVAHQCGDLSQQVRWQFNRLYNRLIRQLPLAPEYRLRRTIHNSVASLASLALALDADFYSLHNEPSMFVASELTKRGLPFAFDLEDWHSENHVYGTDPSVYQILKELEASVFSTAQFVTTTSNVLASAIADFYRCPKPHVIYNSFPDTGQVYQPVVESDFLHICWFSQTVGRGRGLELLCEAISRVKQNFKVSIRGNIYDCAFAEELMHRLGSAANCELSLLPLCSHSELEQWIPSHHVGFASEIPHCLNRDLSITNKMLQYMQSGLCVVATDTRAQLEVADAGTGIHVVSNRDVTSLMQCLELLGSCPKLVAESGRACRRMFEETFSWPLSEQRLQRLFESAIRNSIQF
jgi:glycosyltransferase involved in cell wall biosynthesis